MIDFLSEFDAELRELDRKAMELAAPAMKKAEEISDYNAVKVLNAFRSTAVGAEHLSGSTGYGYGDIGRDKLDELFARIVGAEDALCREQFMSGTHALTVAIFGLVRSGTRFLSATGDPYDTLMPVMRGPGSIQDYGAVYSSVPLLPDGSPDIDGITKAAPEADVVFIQRSHGYDPDRKALSCTDIERITDAVRKSGSRADIIVDNCYGEFCGPDEPLSHGADLIVGSMIKNPGGAVAPTGGYIAGRKDLVEKCADRLTAPGTGRELGCWPAGHRDTFIGLSRAPGIVCIALRTGIYASALFGLLGYECNPSYDGERPDITTVIKLGSEEKLIKFCREVQYNSFVDSAAVPEPWDMPGYDSRVIMASGSFVLGSSIELSCDAPLREPYAVYLQGGTSFACSRYALLKTAAAIGRK
ncbi:MAG: methionine gamma-lyase family protein [Oscillospiraceae bacterium]|jgi:cystathionine beta-lyase family protein involved in aluminum resistance